MKIPRSIVVGLGLLALAVLLVLAMRPPPPTDAPPTLRPGATTHFGPIQIGSQVAGRTITALACTDQQSIRVTVGAGADAMDVELASPLDVDRQPPLGREGVLVFYSGETMPEYFQPVAQSLTDLVREQAPDGTDARVHAWLVEACAADRADE